MNAYILSQPAIYALELTPVCNSRCVGCSNIYADDRSGAPMSGEAWAAIIQEVGPEAVQLKLTGGEPTFNPDFFQILEAATAFDAWVTVFSNGRWLHPHHLVNKLRDWPQLSGMLISLHGAHAESHEAFTGIRGSFQQAADNIRLATENGISVAISTIINHFTWNEIDEIVTLAQDLGAHHVTFNRYLGRSLPGIEATSSELMTAIARIEMLSQQGSPVKYGICVPQCFTPNQSTGCLAGVAYAAIDPWGNLRPCSHSPTIVGSLRTTPVTELWHNKTMNNWRGLMPSNCTTCAAYGDCHGGCRAVQEFRMDKRDPLRGEPLASYQPTPQSIEIPAYGKPQFNGRLRSESFGHVLLGHSTVMPVAHNADQVVSACNGTTTFIQLVDQFGDNALDLLGEMWHSGLLEIK